MNISGQINDAKQLVNKYDLAHEHLVWQIDNTPAYKDMVTCSHLYATNWIDVNYGSNITELVEHHNNGTLIDIFVEQMEAVTADAIEE